MKIQCTAKSKQTGQQCRQPVVKGRTVCHYHGGHNNGTPAPKGNTYALKTGAYQSMVKSLLRPDELQVYESAPTSAVAVLEHQLKMLMAKEYRIMQRIGMIEAASRQWEAPGRFDRICNRKQIETATQADIIEAGTHEERMVLMLAPVDRDQKLQNAEKGLSQVREMIRKCADSLRRAKHPEHINITLTAAAQATAGTSAQDNVTASIVAGSIQQSKQG